MAEITHSTPVSQDLFVQRDRGKPRACVQWKRDFAYEFGIAVVLMAIVYGGQRAGINVAPALFPFAVLAWIKKRPLWQARIGILILCGGSDVMAYVYCALLMLQAVIVTNQRRHTFRITKFTLPLWLFISLALSSWMINQIEEVNLLALPLWALSFLSPLGVFFYFRKWPLSEANLHRFTVFLASVGILQCIASYIDYIGGVGFGAIWAFAETPDGVKGTFKSATDFGYFLLEIFVWCYAIISTHKFLAKNTVIALIAGVITLLFIYTADAKTILGSFVIGILTVIFLFYRWRLRDRATKIIVLFILGALILGPMAVQYIMKSFDLVYVHYLEGEKNNKIQFMERAIDPSNRSMAHWLIGYGPGTCGSRSANARAYDILYKDKSSDANKIKEIFPAHSSKCTRRFLADLYDWHYAETASGRSALLGNPFNSWTAIWFELGILGFFMWSSVFIKILTLSRSMYQIGDNPHRQIALITGINVVAVSVAGLITQQIESPMAMFFLWFFAAHAVGYYQYNEKSSGQ